MSPHETPRKDPSPELSEADLDQVAGGDALDAIRQAVDPNNDRGHRNTMQDPFLKPQDQTCPSSLPYNPL